MTKAPRSRRARALAAVFTLCAGLTGACATSSPVVTKIVGGKVIATRPVDPSAYEHAARALILEEEGRIDEAAAELQRALNFDSDAPELHARLAELLLRLDRVNEAGEAVQASLEHGETIDGLVAEAHLKQRRHDLPGAVVSLRQAVDLAHFPEAPNEAHTAYLELADAQIYALELDDARATLRALAESAASSTTARVRLAALAWALGAPAEAEARLREALAIEPNQLDALVTLAWLYAALGKSDAARARFEEALDRSERALDIATVFARFLLVVGKNKDAEQLADDLGGAAGDDSTLLDRLELERAAHRPERALALGRARRADPELPEDLRARLDVVIAEILAGQGDRDGAVRTLLGVPKTAPSFGESRLRAATLLREGDRVPEARAALEEALTGTMDEELTVEVAIAQVLTDEKAGDVTAAERRVDEAIGKHAGNPRLLLTKAALLERHGRWTRALEVAAEVLEEDPGQQEALNFWGFVAADHEHDLPRARQRVRAALALDPGSGGIIDSVGWAHFRSGELAAAALFLEQAARIEPEDPEILGHLAELYARRGERDRAEKAARKALGGKAEEPLRRRLEELLRRLSALQGGGATSRSPRPAQRGGGQGEGPPHRDLLGVAPEIRADPLPNPLPQAGEGIEVGGRGPTINTAKGPRR